MVRWKYKLWLQDILEVRAANAIETYVSQMDYFKMGSYVVGIKFSAQRRFSLTEFVQIKISRAQSDEKFYGK